ncbi:uncharacterized protein LOC100882771 [Megachile rotundata]|uniref:uncharacterized protein LOC100882771 n=1 Tax=Megachile rotundata TaxID=143995 RepID=UPI003FD3E0E5
MRRNKKNKTRTTICLSERKESMKLLVSSKPGNKSLPYKADKKCNVKTKFNGLNTNFTSSTDDTLVEQTETTITAENKQDETKKMDETYELSEPETPTLQRILKGKRNTKKNNLNIKSEKKHLKVQFKDPILGTSLPSIVNKTSSEKNISTSSTKIFRKRTNSVDNKINTITDSKFLATKEVPNFAEIHKRMFGKLESVVDAKKRLEDRHATLTTVKLNKSMNLSINSKEKDQLLDKPNKSAYNQLGFKIKKQEAIECILRNNSIQNTRSKVQQQSRAILKGVRTNRRFELQMKARNLIL